MMSKYLEQLRRVKCTLPEGAFIIPGDGLLVERLPEGEVKTKGGILLSEPKGSHGALANRPLEVVVVALGEGYYEEGEDIPLDTEVGNVLVVGHHTVRWFSTFPVDGYQPDTLGICNESATQIRFKSIEQYQAFRKASESPAGEVADGQNK